MSSGRWIPTLSDRHFRGLIFIPVFTFSILGDVLVLGLFGAAMRLRPSSLNHTIHKLLGVLFLSNLVASCAYTADFFVVPGSRDCDLAVFFTLAGYAGDYYATIAICILLFRSLVLNRPPPGFYGELLLVALPLVAIVFFGCATIGGAGINKDDFGCWYVDPLGATAITAMVGIGVAVFINLILVITISVRLSRSVSRRTYDGLRIAKGGIMAVNQRASDDVDVLSRRLVMYPVIILVTGGVAIISTSFGNHPVALFFGELALALGGLLNSVAFLFFDPTARKMCSGLIEELDRTEFVPAPDVRMRHNPQWGVKRAESAASSQASQTMNRWGVPEAEYAHGQNARRWIPLFRWLAQSKR
ncbi:hypothetical protein M427DRAFT_32346 [Gonapodya prolifera JEL478]|uniref:G-protein coupled receptors family 2 profile 2 domain-containing protein n=1 Tax=Gonapodya prolifera (strain JEL478) TaxID=1344416 RepID=A0A139AEZ4_GONPJ|nr:hypothetical protein M427DRAFT_32346 [Gonapodya prolifera JEL478]|eukprot:KXS15381.1 hypothetical protein M427DRAFT_32346 [Gonapodya prolifera JEL478]